MSEPLDKGIDLDTIRVAGIHTISTPSPILARGSWLWPDDRTGMEWADKHDERL